MIGPQAIAGLRLREKARTRCLRSHDIGARKAGIGKWRARLSLSGGKGWKEVAKSLGEVEN
jgi:hypothetical protein